MPAFNTEARQPSFSQSSRQNEIGNLMGLWMGGNELGIEIVGSPIIQMLRGKLNRYIPSISNITPNHLLAYVALCTDFNPGYSQVFLKEILLKSKDKVKTCLMYGVPLSQQCVIYSIVDWEYPEMRNQTFAERIRRKYREQQTDRGNLMDTEAWWREVM